MILESPDGDGESGDGSIYPGVKASIGGRGRLTRWLSAFVEVSYHRLFSTPGGPPQGLGAGTVGVEID